MRLLEPHILTCKCIFLIWACLQSYDKQFKQFVHKLLLAVPGKVVFNCYSHSPNAFPMEQNRKFKKVSRKIGLEGKAWTQEKVTAH